MVRQPDDLTGRTFDVLVVGGGVYGLTMAYDAALRGLSVALVERDDFGCGSSFNHLRTIHGGLRYLQTLDVRRARESSRERRILARIAPHTVQPVAFALPLSRSLLRGKTAMRAGAWLDRIIAPGRNRGLPRGLHLAPVRVLSRAAVANECPALLRPGVTGAALWYDYVTLEPDRLTFAWACAAAEHGAILVNHMEALEVLSTSGRATGVRAVDRLTGREFSVSAAVTINATGGALECLLAPIGLAARMPVLKAMNFVTRRDAAGPALGGRTRAGRHLFLVPWRRRALIGTWQSERPCAPGRVTVTPGEVDSFLAEINEAFPALDLERDDITLVHRGLVPARGAPGGTVTLEGVEQIRDHASEGMAGLYSVAGTKYTTARAVAERVVNRVVTRLARSAAPSKSAVEPLPGGDLGDPAMALVSARRAHDHELPADTLPHLVAAYGSRYPAVLQLAAMRPEWRTPVASDSPVIGAQLVWAVRHEMAMTLIDAAVRRTPLGALGHPGEAAAQRAAQIVGDELGWSEERRRLEIGSLQAVYRIDAGLTS